MPDNRALTAAINVRLDAYADRQRKPRPGVRAKTWGAIMGGIFGQAGRPFCAEPHVARAPTVAAALADAQAVKPMHRAVLLENAMRIFAFAARSDSAGAILRDTARATAADSWSSEGADLRNVVLGPAARLADPALNRVRSSLLRLAPRTLDRMRRDAIVLKLYALLRPCYPDKERPTVKDRLRRRIDPVKYPNALMDDMAGLLAAKGGEEFAAWDGARVRRTLRHLQPKHRRAKP